MGKNKQLKNCGGGYEIIQAEAMMMETIIVTLFDPSR
jgi:hypothetical protein